MSELQNSRATCCPKAAWNKGKLVGVKPPLQPKHVWAIRTRLQLDGRQRDPALFNLALDSKLRACDLVWLRVEGIAPHGYAVQRASSQQRKTGRPVRFEITEHSRAAILSRPFKLQQGAGLDLSPSSHWPAPVVADGIAPEGGPVMVTVEYRVAAMRELERARRRDGAYAWGLFEDAALPGRFVEHFMEESWLTHRRHHARVTVADCAVQDRVRALHSGPEGPPVTHLLTPDPATWPAGLYRVGSVVALRHRRWEAALPLRRRTRPEVTYFNFLEYLPASSLSALPAVKRGCSVAGLALKVAGSPVKGLVPLRALVAGL